MNLQYEFLFAILLRFRDYLMRLCEQTHKSEIIEKYVYIEGNANKLRDREKEENKIKD
jgi:hypothetical protein